MIFNQIRESCFAVQKGAYLCNGEQAIITKIFWTQMINPFEPKWATTIFSNYDSIFACSWFPVGPLSPIDRQSQFYNSPQPDQVGLWQTVSRGKWFQIPSLGTTVLPFDVSIFKSQEMFLALLHTSPWFTHLSMIFPKISYDSFLGFQGSNRLNPNEFKFSLFLLKFLVTFPRSFEHVWPFESRLTFWEWIPLSRTFQWERFVYRWH